MILVFLLLLGVDYLIEKLVWHKELCSYLEINENNLPNLYSYNKKYIGLKKEYKNRWSELCDTPFFLAVGDGLSANIGSGATKSNRIGLTIGSTGAIRLLRPKSNKKILHLDYGNINLLKNIPF